MLPYTPISVIIPCKDELPHIEACLRSVRSVADEIIVADSGSTDGTLELVRSRDDCRVIEREYVCYSSFNNWAIPQAKYEWVLVVDADERVSAALAEEILSLKRGGLATTPHEGFWIPRKNVFLNRKIRFSGWQHDGAKRLFRRHCRLTDANVHPELDIPKHKTGTLHSPLQHYTFRSFSHFFRKLSRYAAWSANDLQKKGRRVSVANLCARPAFRFFRQYVLQFGFLDGRAGLVICASTAFYVFMKYVHLWELQVGDASPVREQTHAKAA